MASVVLNGVTYTDDSNATTGMANGGHRVRFVPCLANFVIEAATQLGLQHASRDAADASEAAALASQNAAAASALTALNAPGTSATSTTPLTIGLGSKTLTIQTGKAIVVGHYVGIAYSTNANQIMQGIVTAYNSGTGSLTVNVLSALGSGTYSTWTVGISAQIKVSTNLSSRTSDIILGPTDSGSVIDITSGTFTQTFSAASVLGVNWYCYIRNSGTGDITLDPNASETIDGISSFILYPKAVRLIICDGTALRSMPIVAGIKKFTSSGTYVVAPGIASHNVTTVGAGGGGASGERTYTGINGIATQGYGGGAGGELMQRQLFGLTPGSSISTTVPAGGSGGASISTTAGAKFRIGSQVMEYSLNYSYGNIYDSIKYLNNTWLYTVHNGNTGYVINAMTGASITTTTFPPRSIEYDGSVYVVVGGGYGGTGEGRISSGAALTSLTSRTVPSHFPYTTISYLASIDYFAAGSSNGEIVTSQDGTTWTNQTSPFGTSAINRISHNGSYFIAVADGGKLAQSTNGTTWIIQTTGTTQPLHNAVWSPTLSIWVVCGALGTILTSSNGTSWTSRTYGAPTAYILSLYWSNQDNAFFAGDPFSYLRTSTDGIIWTAWSTNMPSNLGQTLTSWHNGIHAVFVKTQPTTSTTFATLNDSVIGNIGNTSGNTSFGSYVKARPGEGGSVSTISIAGGIPINFTSAPNTIATGQAVPNTTGNLLLTHFGGGFGGHPAFTDTGGRSLYAGGGGGCGGYSIGAGKDGGASGFINNSYSGGGGAGGVTTGATGAAGTIPADSYCGSGGGGGGGSWTSSGGNGGNGATPGGGGGGGGLCSYNGVGASGAGGSGGNGEVLVVEVI